MQYVEHTTLIDSDGESNEYELDVKKEQQMYIWNKSFGVMIFCIRQPKLVYYSATLLVTQELPPVQGSPICAVPWVFVGTSLFMVLYTFQSYTLMLSTRLLGSPGIYSLSCPFAEMARMSCLLLPPFPDSNRTWGHEVWGKWLHVLRMHNQHDLCPT